MSDLVERLRNPRYASDRIEFLECRIEAADEIERLTAENRKLRDWVDRIYYANIAMNNEGIKAVVEEIALDGWITESASTERDKTSDKSQNSPRTYTADSESRGIASNIVNTTPDNVQDCEQYGAIGSDTGDGEQDIASTQQWAEPDKQPPENAYNPEWDSD